MTDSKTATERLRELLDERDVLYSIKPSNRNTTWIRNGWWYNAKIEPWSESTCKVTLYDVTPEQAVAVTLGRGECMPTEDWHCPCGQDLVSCDIGIGANGGAVELDPPILFNFCPNCGKAVKR